MKIVKLILLVFLFQFALLTVNAKETNRKDDNLKKPNFDEDKFSILYINRWTNWASKDGRLSINPSGASGGCFPIDGTGVIYTDGLVWGGKVSNEPNIRVGGQTYNSGTVPGHWGSDHSDESTRIYRIKKDFKKLHREDFRREARIYFLYGMLGEVRDEDIDNLAAQYANDWENWPVDLGAPYIDRNNNGTYDG
ncbi:MAG: hypothetical protein KAR38_06260, partial [Calditrichia bacterium]|nr:hypothetical protein [Calditrichia bacterium]